MILLYENIRRVSLLRVAYLYTYTYIYLYTNTNTKETYFCYYVISFMSTVPVFMSFCRKVNN